MKKGILIFLMFLIFEIGYSQSVSFSDSNIYIKKDSFTFWKLIDVSGNVFLKGQNRKHNFFRRNFEDIRNSTIYSGGLLLNTKSYFWSPNFLLLNITGEYNPEFNKDIYLIIPDQAEVRTLNRFNMQATFFKSKPITLSTFLNFSNVYQNRENLTNIRSNSRTYGASLNHSNKILPYNLRYSNTKWNQREIQSNRNYYFNQSNFRVNTSKSFTKYYDKNDLSYTNNQYQSKILQITTINNYDKINLNDNIYFDAEKNYHLHSIVTKDFQRGTYLNQNRLQAFENLSIKLPHNLNFIGNYNLNNTLADSIRTIQNNIRGTLRHKLYQSLYSDIFYEYSNIKRNYLNESRIKTGFDLKYIKKIPLEGVLNITYAYYRQFNSTTANDVLLQIFREDHVLSDGEIVLLNKAYIDSSTILVFDVTGTIIYQEGLDYILIKRNSYYEIRRMPGGLISNNSTVYVSYTATQPGSYKYNINYHLVTASVTLWKNLFQVYYRFIKQNYVNLISTDYLTLNYITQNVVGTKLQYDFASGGIEYDYYNSSIVPYKMYKIFVNLQKSFNNKVTSVLNANIRNYTLLEDSSINKLFDISSQIFYRINSSTSIKLTGSYLKQDIYGSKLDLLVAGEELTTVYRKLYFSLGIDFYLRTYLSDKDRLKGVYLKILRKF